MIELNYKKYGNGNHTLIILHGFLGSLDNWHSLATEWGNSGITVYTIDQRNHGKSPHTATHTINDMVEDLFDFMHQQNINKATLLGHSMGGKVVMQFALTYPQMTETLIVADMSPRAYKHGHDDVFNAIKNVNLAAIQTRKDAEEMMKPFLGDFGTRQFVLKNLERTEAGSYQWKFNFDVLYRDYENILQLTESATAFTAPVLFLKGGLSLYIQEKDFPLIKELFPASRIETIEQAGHWLHAEKPKEVFKAVLDFIKE